MGIEILTARQIEKMRRAGRAAAATLAFVGARLRPGVTTERIDRWVREDTARRGGKPSQLGYHGFPASVCTSPNDVACHGVPSKRVHLEEGDLISVDVTTDLGGYHGDTCATFLIGKPSPEAEHIVSVAHRCREVGIAEVRAGARLGDIGAAVEALAVREGCSVVVAVGGHGIGREMHQEPHVSYVGKRGRGRRLRAGMAITIEPILNLGGPALQQDADGWTLRTADGSLSAQFEHTLLVTRDGCEVLTQSGEHTSFPFR